MNVTIDVRMCRSSGIGTYIRNLVPRVVRALPHLYFNLLLPRSEMDQDLWRELENAELILADVPIYSIAEQLILPRVIPRSTDLYWSPHYAYPWIHPGKLLVTVHDLFHLARPEYVGGFHKRLYARAMFRALRHQADAIVCGSEFTKNELVRLTGANPRNTKVIPYGVDGSWGKIATSAAPRANPYVLYVGNVKPHKNLSRLLKAFTRLVDEIPHDLVIIGQREGFITGDPKVGAEASILGPRVDFTGFVDESVLQQHFVHADALVLPSLYEGFGLPPLEAMKCGCPALVSNVASLPEVCGEAALYFDPHSEESIANELHRLLRSPDLQATMRQRGLQHSQQFTWERCASSTCDVIQQLLR